MSLPDSLRPQDQGFDLGVDFAGQARGVCLLAGDLLAAGCHALHDLLLDGYVDTRQGRGMTEKTSLQTLAVAKNRLEFG